MLTGISWLSFGSKIQAACSRNRISILGRVKCFRGQLKYYGTRAEIRFSLSAKLTSPFKSSGTSFQSTTCSWGLRVSGSNAGYTMFRSSVKSTGYPLHSPVSSTLPLPCVTVCHHISTGVYLLSETSRPTPPPVNWVAEGLYLGQFRPKREADDFPESSVSVEKALSHTSTPLYVLVACTGQFLLYFIRFVLSFPQLRLSDNSNLVPLVLCTSHLSSTALMRTDTH